MNGIVDLNLWQMAASYIFIIILLLIVRARGISREKEILISTVRMTVQLILTGYILVYLFDNIHYLYTITVIVAMEIFAIINIFKRTKTTLSKSLKKLSLFPCYLVLYQVLFISYL